MAATDEMVAIAREIRPDMVTLVPEKRQELTTEGGLDVGGNREKIARAVGQLHEKSIRVSLFVDADDRQVDAAKAVAADMIEIHTGRYSDAGRRDSEARRAGAGDRRREAGKGARYGRERRARSPLP